MAVVHYSSIGVSVLVLHYAFMCEMQNLEDIEKILRLLARSAKNFDVSICGFAPKVNVKRRWALEICLS
jgi:hypothetical protein